MFGLFILDSVPIFRLLQTIMNNGVEWGVITMAGLTNPLSLKRFLKKNGIESWGYFTTHDRFEVQADAPRSENYMTREELLNAHPALSADWGQARLEARQQADFDAESAPAPQEHEDVFVTVFCTKKKDAVRAYNVMSKKGIIFYRIPSVVIKKINKGEV